MSPLRKLILSSPTGDEQAYRLDHASIVLGRSTTSDVELHDGKASRAHARVDCDATGCVVVDLGSANGTFVNGERVERRVLAPGDLLTLGETVFRFHVEEPQTEPDLIPIDSEADLDATLAQATVPVLLAHNNLPRLAVHAPDKTWEMPILQERLTLGRHGDNDICIDHPKVSRRHAQIERVGDGFQIRDLGSTNGTWIGARRIETHRLTGGETLQIGDTRLVFKGAFTAEDLTLVDARPLSAGARQARRPVVFVPGMMGSELWRGSERLWPNVKLMFTQPEVYAYRPQDGIAARGIVGDVVLVPNLIRQQRYNRLGDYLEEALGYGRGRDLLEFAYDWRQDLRRSAQQLAAAIEAWGVDQPVTLIAHSLGCMVSRYYVERYGGKDRVRRLILLGGPHAGYPRAVAHLLAGTEVLPFGVMGERVRRVLATFPAMYQILPSDLYVKDQTGQPLDILTDERWLAEEHRPLLRNARDFRRELGVRARVPAVSVFGYGLKTMIAIRVERKPNGAWQHVEFDQQEGGDSDIPESSAVLLGSEIHPVQQHHGSLYVDNDVKMRLRLELSGEQPLP